MSTVDVSSHTAASSGSVRHGEVPADSSRKSDDSDLQQASPNQDALDGEKPTHLWTSARVVGIIFFTAPSEVL